MYMGRDLIHPNQYYSIPIFYSVIKHGYRYFIS